MDLGKVSSYNMELNDMRKNCLRKSEVYVLKKNSF